MPSRILALVLPFLAVIGAIAGFIAVDYSRSLRDVAQGEEPSFAEYAAARIDGLRGRGADSDGARVAAIGAVPGSVETASAEDGAASWFRKDQKAAPVQFSCTTGPGGSKICSSRTD